MTDSLTFDEQEILVLLNGKDDRISIHTTYPHWIKRLDKYCEENPEEWHVEDEYVSGGRVLSRSYSALKEYLKLQKKKRHVSEEQRRASAERLAAYRNKSS